MVRVTIGCDETPWLKVEEKRVYLAYCFISQFIIEDSQGRQEFKQGRSWVQELIKTPQKSVAFLWYLGPPAQG